MADHRLDPRAMQPSDTEGDTFQTIDGVAAWGPAPASGVEAVVAGDGITVDDSDPANPVVSATGPTGRREVMMASGVTPPEPLASSDGYDLLYGEVSS